jgi:hypothetical protein
MSHRSRPRHRDTVVSACGARSSLRMTRNHCSVGFLKGAWYGSRCRGSYRFDACHRRMLSVVPHHSHRRGACAYAAGLTPRIQDVQGFTSAPPRRPAGDRRGRRGHDAGVSRPRRRRRGQRLLQYQFFVNDDRDCVPQDGGVPASRPVARRGAPETARAAGSSPASSCLPDVGCNRVELYVSSRLRHRAATSARPSARATSTSAPGGSSSARASGTSPATTAASSTRSSHAASWCSHEGPPRRAAPSRLLAPACLPRRQPGGGPRRALRRRHRLHGGRHLRPRTTGACLAGPRGGLLRGRPGGRASADAYPTLTRPRSINADERVDLTLRAPRTVYGVVTVPDGPDTGRYIPATLEFTPTDLAGVSPPVQAVAGTAPAFGLQPTATARVHLVGDAHRGALRRGGAPGLDAGGDGSAALRARVRGAGRALTQRFDLAYPTTYARWEGVIEGDLGQRIPGFSVRAPSTPPPTTACSPP